MYLGYRGNRQEIGVLHLIILWSILQPEQLQKLLIFFKMSVSEIYRSCDVSKNPDGPVFLLAPVQPADKTPTLPDHSCKTHNHPHKSNPQPLPSVFPRQRATQSTTAKHQHSATPRFSSRPLKHVVTSLTRSRSLCAPSSVTGSRVGNASLSQAPSPWARVQQRAAKPTSDLETLISSSPEGSD